MTLRAPSYAVPRPEPRKRVKARQHRSAAGVLRAARLRCVERDGRCLLSSAGLLFPGIGLCRGESTLAHLWPYRRGQTRGRPAEERHDPARMAMLCETHAHLEEREGLRIEPTTDAGMFGPFRLSTHTQGSPNREGCMSYVRVESSVRTNRKFLQAGPAASWLWLCGLAYCQDTLTDGFIPGEAIQYLGIERPYKLITKLVESGLWEEDANGWHIHDYLAHNKPAAEINRIKNERREGGKLGGRRQPTETLKVTEDEPSRLTMRETFPVGVGVGEVVAVGSSSEERNVTPKLDVWLRELFEAYPQQSVTRSRMTEDAFFDAIRKHPGGPFEAWTLMRSNLDNQKRGYQWRVKRMIPKLDGWLSDGKWLQQHDENPPTALVSEKTSRTLTSAAAFIKAGGE